MERGDHEIVCRQRKWKPATDLLVRGVRGYRAYERREESGTFRPSASAL